VLIILGTVDSLGLINDYLLNTRKRLNLLLTLRHYRYAQYNIMKHDTRCYFNVRALKLT